MADVKISALPATAAQNLTDLLAKVGGINGITEKMTVQQLFALVTGRFKGPPGNPTVIVTANSGTGATVTVDANSTDTAGLITYTPGVGPAAGIQLVLTFAVAYTTVPYIQFCAGNAQAALLNQISGWNVINPLVSGFSLNARVAPTASAAFLVYYQVTQ